MKQDEYELYNILIKVKDSLQDKFYNSEIGRKPSICTDDSLKLLAKYKPKNLLDMANISGIGSSFIENYGTYFLDVIKNYTSSDTVILNDEEKIILSKLENRLVNINKRNRLLYSSKINKEYGLDLYKFLSNIEEFEKFILSRSTGSFKLIDIVDFDDEKLKTILKLIRQANKIEVENGNNELYVAYPFVQGKMEMENFNIKAPLLLFPVKLERTINSILLKNDVTRDIIYNTNLILANNKFNGKNEVLPDNAIEDFHESSYLDDLMTFYSNNKLYIQNKGGSIEKFLENKLSEFPSYKHGELEIKKYMVLGLYSTYITAMYEDFHKMIQENNVTDLIKKLLWGAEVSLQNFDITYDESEKKEQKETSFEQTINYINELDYSQEQVLNVMNQTDSIVVQGPPGTGKSQTITSLISQAILQGQNVLMVSEKKTALDVIYSRLGELSKFAILIDDIENKTAFYSEIESIISTMNSTQNLIFKETESKTNTMNLIQEKIVKITEATESLDKIASQIYGINDFGTSMYHIYNTCQRFDLTNQEQLAIYSYINSILSEVIRNLKFFELTKIYELFNDENSSACLESYLNIVAEYPLINTMKTNLADVEVITFINDLTQLEDFINVFNSFPFYKKIFEKGKLKKIVSDIANKYFEENNKIIVKDIIAQFSYLKSFLANYGTFVANKYLYQKLSFQEKEYINLINIVKNNCKIEFRQANRQIYHIILYNIIIEFEKNNVEVFNYIGNFDGIRTDIRKNIVEKKELTKKLAFNLLLDEVKKLNDNNKLSKIEEMCNRKRKMSINKFMSKYKLELFDSIKIWLMTPEVVSDILPFEKNVFDLIIFDEASQLYVEKSIPGIYRAKRIVVAGDQKQLKPSSLGQGRILDEVDEEELADGFLEYESLLEAARYKYKQTMLNYHYRSNYEELIAFSNYAFYNGKLMVISSASKSNEKPIERVKVEKGRWIDKKNEEEAKEVVNLVKNILETRKKNETIGVITFNASQMNLIEDLIEKEKMVDSSFATKMLSEENRFSNGENISFFVKNIEAVQGDERDIIIFCIGYAKNEHGKVAINFGWLSQDGGENRLNVAISRAKQKIYVVTSIEPEELVVDSTKNDGPKLFKKYLEYVKALDENDIELTKNILLSLLDKNDLENQQLSFDSEFEEEVYNKLTNEGYEVVTQYGVGGYRIDLVVKDKDGSNLLGIECDGRLYHSKKSARERDYHRQKYLESRGWKIYRIWSTNWWRNADLEIKKINQYIKKINK